MIIVVQAIAFLNKKERSHFLVIILGKAIALSFNNFRESDRNASKVHGDHLKYKGRTPIRINP
ncbi:hypothetical protein [Planktothrix agardhii]|uniref:hypothetical protein n=1 Tax=Planktothrix agardhii TaxID=1160 RepID=UPI00041A5A73|nr:hypothetical protein [Planktothrix agardhii]